MIRGYDAPFGLPTAVVTAPVLPFGEIKSGNFFWFEFYGDKKFSSMGLNLFRVLLLKSLMSTRLRAIVWFLT